MPNNPGVRPHVTAATVICESSVPKCAATSATRAFRIDWRSKGAVMPNIDNGVVTHVNVFTVSPEK